MARGLFGPVRSRLHCLRSVGSVVPSQRQPGPFRKRRQPWPKRHLGPGLRLPPGRNCTPRAQLPTQSPRLQITPCCPVVHCREHQFSVQNSSLLSVRGSQWRDVFRRGPGGRARLRGSGAFLRRSQIPCLQQPTTGPTAEQRPTECI
jgi:hypothetical protein